MVTFDRKLKKDAFYLYKAAWSKEPVVHICGSRYVDRTEEVTEIKVYSNFPEVTLYVDGKLFAAQRGQRVFKFHVPISGDHSIEANAGGYSSVIFIRKVTQQNPEYVFVKKQDVVNWFDQDDFDPDCYSVSDTIGELRKHPGSNAIVDDIIAKGAASRGDVAESVKDNPALLRMMNRITLISLLKQAGGFDEETIKQLNRVLQRIKKV